MIVVIIVVILGLRRPGIVCMGRRHDLMSRRGRGCPRVAVIVIIVVLVIAFCSDSFAIRLRWGGSAVLIAPGSSIWVS